VAVAFSPCTFYLLPFTSFSYLSPLFLPSPLSLITHFHIATSQHHPSSTIRDTIDFMPGNRENPARRQLTRAVILASGATRMDGDRNACREWDEREREREEGRWGGSNDVFFFFFSLSRFCMPAASPVSS
jgi:hypothetical protein